MSLYPSLEDMKMDHLGKAQLSFESHVIQTHQPFQSDVSGTLYPAIQPSAPPSYSQFSAPPSAAPLSSAPPSYTPPNLPYPVSPNENSALYPSLSDYMGLELSPAIIAANMPEYLQSANKMSNTEIVSVGSEARETPNNMVAPLSGQSLGLQRAQVSHGIREVTLCKDASGKVGLRVTAVNNGVFVCLVNKGSPASLCGIRFGDQILQINGVNVAGYSMNQVHDMFRKSGVNGIKVIVRDRPFERTVTLHKDSVGHIGFQFKSGQIIRIVKDSSAARNGLLTEHNLLEVDGQNVVGLKDKEIAAIIESAPNFVTITIIPTFIYTHMIKKMNVNLIKSAMDHSVPII